MGFLKNVASGILKGAADHGERQRDLANEILATRGDRLTEEQRRKAEAYAYSSAPEEARELAERLKKD